MSVLTIDKPSDLPIKSHDAETNQLTALLASIDEPMLLVTGQGNGIEWFKRCIRLYRLRCQVSVQIHNLFSIPV